MTMPAGERRIVSVLVADVAGSTEIGEKLGPERSKFLFDEIVRLMGEEVERFGGTVAQLTGDGLLALFGAPVAHDDDSERAVRAALAINDALRTYGAEIAPAYGIDLASRVAVNTGPVVVPNLDVPPDQLYNALGDTVNVAARLQQLGDLVVGPTTAPQVETAFELAALGDVTLKGKAERVRAFRVVRIRSEPASRPEPPLVGREQEVRFLSVQLDGLFDARGAVVSVTGEPGIGKSRLIAEVEQRFAGRIRFLAGHAVDYAERIPYWPVREQLRSWLGLGVSEPEARVRLELRAELARVFADAANDAYPFLATLLGLKLESEDERKVDDLARDAVQRETFHWLYELVGSLAGEQPICLVFDDLQWSDDATLLLLEEVLPVVEQAPVCFLLVHRSDPDHPAWQLVDRARRRFRHRFSELEPQPLRDEDVRMLSEAAAEGELPAQLAQMLAEQTGGNPYFVSEAVRDLRERGVLERQNGHLTLVGEASIPAAIQEALQARLDRLDPEARELITTAAVVGRSFGLPLLERVLPRARLLPTLSELQWLQLVVEERGGAAPEYRFRHGLVQEAAYGTLVEAQRRELHLRVGEALAELHRDSPGEVYGLLAHHFTEADDADRAVEFLLKAGDAARAVYADDDALELYRRALDFMERTGDDERARITLFRIGLTHHLAFDFRAASEAFREAFARPRPAEARLEPTEHVTWATGAPWFWERLAPGLTGSDLASQVIRNLFRGLVLIGPDLEIEPDLAESFTVSEDGRSYQFTLRGDARWSDGVPVQADDFVFTFERMREEADDDAGWLDGLRASVVDESVLDIELHEPRNHFLHMLGRPELFAWPRHVYVKRGRDWHARLPSIGCGPFVLTGRVAPAGAKPGRMTLEAAPFWYGSRGNVAEVAITLEPIPAQAGERWRRGEYDLFYDGLAEVVGLELDQNTVADRASGGIVRYLGLDATRPPLDDARIRRALAHAIDREGHARVWGGNAANRGGMLPPEMPGHSPRVAPGFDPEAARALLREAGHAEGRDLGELVFPYLRIYERGAASISDHLASVGFRTRKMPIDSVKELNATINEHAHMYLWGWTYAIADPAGGFLGPLFRAIPFLYHDAELDGLLASALAARNQAERLRKCREFERIWIGKQAAVVPLTYTDRQLWRRPWVAGMSANTIAPSTFAEAVVIR
jgi:ABC-type transport system substrate-binding protein/class 3 adenylate cyclase